MDVRLYQTDDGGEIDVIGGQEQMADGLGTACYLSLFGGNERDSGLTADDSKQFWANLVEDDPNARYRSKTQALLTSLTLIPANLRALEDAAADDLSWLVPSIASDVAVDATMPALRSVLLNCRITVSGKTYLFSFPVSST